MSLKVAGDIAASINSTAWVGVGMASTAMTTGSTTGGAGATGRAWMTGGLARLAGLAAAFATAGVFAAGAFAASTVATAAAFVPPALPGARFDATEAIVSLTPNLTQSYCAAQHLISFATAFKCFLCAATKCHRARGRRVVAVKPVYHAPMKMIALLVLPLMLAGCVGTVASVVTAPVRAVGWTADRLTTSQREADEKRGRAERKAEEKRGRDARKAAKRAREDARDGA